jgi:hypothetical protein
MKVLMIDVGGTNVKVMASHEGEMRRVPSREKSPASFTRRREGREAFECPGASATQIASGSPYQLRVCNLQEGRKTHHESAYFFASSRLRVNRNAKFVDLLPENCRCVDNRSAYIGAQRLWEGSDLFASACATSWRIHRNEAHI